MEVRVSPAVVVVVLILVAAILVGLYFMVVAQPGKPVAAGVAPAVAPTQPAAMVPPATAQPAAAAPAPAQPATPQH